VPQDLTGARVVTVAYVNGVPQTQVRDTCRHLALQFPPVHGVSPKP